MSQEAATKRLHPIGRSWRWLWL